MVFRYAIATGRATRDISLDLRGALTTPKVSHRPAVTEPAEVGALLRAIDGYTGQPTTRMALQLSALLFVRPGEIRHASWREFDFSEAVWRILGRESYSKIGWRALRHSIPVFISLLMAQRNNALQSLAWLSQFRHNQTFGVALARCTGET
jgi:integrase